jgi:hypothetical protein
MRFLTVTVADETGKIYETPVAVPNTEAAVPDALAAAFVLTSEIEPDQYDWRFAAAAADEAAPPLGPGF